MCQRDSTGVKIFALQGFSPEFQTLVSGVVFQALLEVVPESHQS